MIVCRCGSFVCLLSAGIHSKCEGFFPVCVSVFVYVCVYVFDDFKIEPEPSSKPQGMNTRGALVHLILLIRVIHLEFGIQREYALHYL